MPARRCSRSPSSAWRCPGRTSGITWRLGVAATAFDSSDRTLTLADGDRLRPDGVVLATGAAPMPLPGMPSLRGVHLLRTIDEARALRADLARGGRLVVVGGGFIGSEVASTARQLGLDVTVVEAAPTAPRRPGRPADGRGPVGPARRGRHPAGVRGRGQGPLVGSDAVEGVELADGRVLPADVVVVGIGARPVTRWLEGSGIELAEGHRGVVCDAAGATNRLGVVAVGDCSAWHDEEFGGPHRVEHWTSAHERGPLAAATLLGLEPPRLRGGRAPYFWSDQYGLRIQFAGTYQAGDEVTIEEGSVEERSLLAVYRRRGQPVAVLALDRPRPFTQLRRSLGVTPNHTDRTDRTDRTERSRRDGMTP